MTTLSDLMETGLLRHEVDAHGTRIHVAEVGSGPLVLFVHGFPESWYSWRHQLPVVAAAGFRAAAIDVRGYGSSAAPEAISAYRLLDLAGDCIGVVEALGESEAVIVGHDWGSPISATAAQIRPDVFTALALLSVPYTPRSNVRPTDLFRAMGGPDEIFYIDYFQDPGVAEAEIADDPVAWLKAFYLNASGDAPPIETQARPRFFTESGGTLVNRLSPWAGPLPWLAEEDISFYTSEFARVGFTGGLNRYRCIDYDWVDLRAWHEAPIAQPSLFIGGEHDGPTLLGAGSIARFVDTLPGLRGSVILKDVGHWIQQEDAPGTNAALLHFLAGL